jgi:hypothetical protein
MNIVTWHVAMQETIKEFDIEFEILPELMTSSKRKLYYMTYRNYDSGGRYRRASLTAANLGMIPEKLVNVITEGLEHKQYDNILLFETKEEIEKAKNNLLRYLCRIYCM